MADRLPARFLSASVFFQGRIGQRTFRGHDLVGKNAAGHVEVVGREDAGQQQIHGVGAAGFFIGCRHAPVVALAPERRRVDAAFFYKGQAQLRGVEVVKGEQAGDGRLFGHGRNKAGHPVVAVDQVGLHLRHNAVDHLPLKGQGDFDGIPSRIGGQFGDVIKRAVLNQVNALLRQIDVFPQIAGTVEQPAIVGNGQMNIHP